MAVVEVIVEGQTEERFVKQLMAPAFRQLNVFLKPMLLQTSATGRGGAISFDRLKHYARNILRRSDASRLTTLLDLYALDSSFPGMNAAKRQPTLAGKVSCLNHALHAAVVAHAGCRPECFIAHIQPHEFEGLLFSDVAALCQTEPAWAKYEPSLQQVRAAHETPEHINHGYKTKPSSRLKNLLKPAYKKTLHGPRAAELVTLAVIERECPYFHHWMNQLRALA